VKQVTPTYVMSRLLTTGMFIHSDWSTLWYWCASELRFQGFRHTRSYCNFITYNPLPEIRGQKETRENIVWFLCWV